MNLIMVETISGQHQELGKVNWLRSYDEALMSSKQSEKPILILFQEVPGCATCRNYGNDVLSDPLMVDIIEHYFVPLTIFNNHKGEDAKILKKYGEPSWNNPVVRIVDQYGKDIQKRLSGQYSKASLISYIAKSFPERNQAIPSFINLVDQQFNIEQKDIKTLDYSMYCFWSGESHIGSLEGVISTEPGFKDGREVVRVTYDSSKLSEKTLTEHANNASCQIMANYGQYTVDKDPQYYLKQSEYKYLPLTKFQRTKINSALKNKSEVDKYLSPSQKHWLTQIKSNQWPSLEILYTKPFTESWDIMKNR
jgi:hypothetical protein